MLNTTTTVNRRKKTFSFDHYFFCKIFFMYLFVVSVLFFCMEKPHANNGTVKRILKKETAEAKKYNCGKIM